MCNGGTGEKRGDTIGDKPTRLRRIYPAIFPSETGLFNEKEY
jgi:hypothetical protein